MALYQITTTPYVNGAQLAVASTVKATKGSLYAISVYNPNASAAYLQIFDAASVTVGTTVAKQSYGIPATGLLNLIYGDGSPFVTTNSIKIAASTTPTGNTAPGTGLVVNMLYS